MKIKSEAACIAGHIATFINSYAPSQQTDSGNTLKSYQDTLGLYIQYLEAKGITPEKLAADCFNRETIEGWLLWLASERRNSPETRNNRLASLRTFLKYLASREARFIALYQSASQINRAKVQKKKVKGLSRPAVKALMEAPDPSKRTGQRDLVMMMTLYGTAARIDEILSLKVKHLHLEGAKPHATIVGKGNKVRTLYLLPRLVAHLKKYLANFHGENPDPNAYVFFSRNEGIYGKLTPAAVDKMLKKHAVAAHEKCGDVPIKLHAHQFRHARASHWLEDGMNIVQISFLLGHEQIQTTMVYLDITTEDEAKALMTLQDEAETKVVPKWKNPDGSLRNFCGLPPRKT